MTCTIGMSMKAKCLNPIPTFTGISTCHTNIRIIRIFIDAPNTDRALPSLLYAIHIIWNYLPT